MSEQKAYHTPVLLKACIENLNIHKDGTYVDLTFGGGGHSKAILKELGPKGRLFAFDQDEDAHKNAISDERFTLVPQNFRFLRNYLRLNKVNAVNGILADLGVSSHQFDEAERGFTFRQDAPLDMRMNRKQELSAEKVVNEYSGEKLASIFREYGDLTNTGKMARLIVNAREVKKISTTAELCEVLKPVTPKFESSKFLAKVFQSIRIEVNAEMEVLKDALTQCAELLVPGGRLVVISYHSLEDRMVKNLIRSGNTDGVEEKDPVYGRSEKRFKNLTSKPIVPDEEECRNNTRARSAKLRVGEKLKMIKHTHKSGQ